MHPEHSHQQDEPNNGNNESWLFSRTGVATLVAVSILGFLVYEGHGAHLLGALPFLFILACPLMHIFMHGGHHHGNDEKNTLHGSESPQVNNTQPATDPKKNESHKHHGGI